MARRHIAERHVLDVGRSLADWLEQHTESFAKTVSWVRIG
jgi:hypothetical protein